MTIMTDKQKHELYQNMWALRNKMTEQMEKLENVHAKSFPTVSDGIEALYAVHNVWNSKEYSNLESVINEIRG